MGFIKRSHAHSNAVTQLQNDRAKDDDMPLNRGQEPDSRLGTSKSQLLSRNDWSGVDLSTSSIPTRTLVKAKKRKRKSKELLKEDEIDSNSKDRNRHSSLNVSPTKRSSSRHAKGGRGSDNEEERASDFAFRAPDQDGENHPVDGSEDVQDCSANPRKTRVVGTDELDEKVDEDSATPSTTNAQVNPEPQRMEEEEPLKVFQFNEPRSTSYMADKLLLSSTSFASSSKHTADKEINQTDREKRFKSSEKERKGSGSSQDVDEMDEDQLAKEADQLEIIRRLKRRRN